MTITDADAKVPTAALCDLVANLTEEGLELVRRLLAFAADYREASATLDLEAAELDHDDERYQAAAVTAGLLVLHAMVEQMSTALSVALGISEEDVDGAVAA
ncbi:MAG: hypothetical protein M3P34_07960 [Actinomycetota bacterium]|nr:hypothetical protein [Actinomycetota bacterium]